MASKSLYGPCATGYRKGYQAALTGYSPERKGKIMSTNLTVKLPSLADVTAADADNALDLAARLLKGRDAKGMKAVVGIIGADYAAEQSQRAADTAAEHAFLAKIAANRAKRQAQGNVNAFKLALLTLTDAETVNVETDSEGNVKPEITATTPTKATPTKATKTKATKTKAL